MTRRLWLAAAMAMATWGPAPIAADGCCPFCRTPTKRFLGPDEMPCRLEGTWKVSMVLDVVCNQFGHTYLRYENVETGEVHTVGRYCKGWGGARQIIGNPTPVSPAPFTGVVWDIDLAREPHYHAGELYSISTVVVNPIVYRGNNGGWGHGGPQNNCNTHVRDGWHYYTGEWYSLPPMWHTSNCLLKKIARRHPEILCGH